MSEQPPRRRRVWRKVGWAAALLAAVLLVLVVAAPSLVAHTPLRNSLLGWLLKGTDFRASTEVLSCGWFAPLQLKVLTVEHSHELLNASVEQLRFEQSWWRVFFNLPALGAIHIERPDVDLVWDPIAWKPKGPMPPWVMSMSLHDAALRIRSAKGRSPIVSLGPLDLKAKIVQRGSGRVVEVEPFTVLAGAEVTSQLCDQGLQLIAPVLADAVRVEGHVTLRITELSGPLDSLDSKRAEQLTRVRGVLEMDQVKTELKNPLLQQVTALVAKIFKLQIPHTLEVADDTVVDFELRDGRVYHTGLSFLLPELSPDLVWKTSGTVGFDETLDLIVEAKLPLTLLYDSPLTQKLSDRPLELHVTGTFNSPKVELRKSGGWVSELIGLATSLRGAEGAEKATAPDGTAEPKPNDQAEKDPLVDSIFDLVGRAADKLREASANRPKPLLESLRERRKAAQEEAGAEKKPRLFGRGLLRRRDRAEKAPPPPNEQAPP